jgi:hypothetical protein
VYLCNGAVALRCNSIPSSGSSAICLRRHDRHLGEIGPAGKAADAPRAYPSASGRPGVWVYGLRSLRSAAARRKGVGAGEIRALPCLLRPGRTPRGRCWWAQAEPLDRYTREKKNTGREAVGVLGARSVVPALGRVAEVLRAGRASHKMSALPGSTAGSSPERDVLRGLMGSRQLGSRRCVDITLGDTVYA